MWFIDTVVENVDKNISYCEVADVLLRAAYIDFYFF